MSVDNALQLVVFDVDGVMTDGRFVYTAEGKVSKTFGPDDGDALKVLRRHVDVAFVSADGRGFPITEKRIAVDMGHELALVSQGERLDWIAARAPLARVAYMGDSFTDIPVLKAVGTGITTSDALPGVQRAATYVTRRRGGDRAVAEACFYLLARAPGPDRMGGDPVIELPAGAERNPRLAALAAQSARWPSTQIGDRRGERQRRRRGRRAGPGARRLADADRQPPPGRRRGVRRRLRRGLHAAGAGRARARAPTTRGRVVVCRDHGGPWQGNGGYAATAEQAMDDARTSFFADLDAGFDLLHIDTSPSAAGRPTARRQGAAARALRRLLAAPPRERGTDDRVRGRRRGAGQRRRRASTRRARCWSRWPSSAQRHGRAAAAVRRRPDRHQGDGAPQRRLALGAVPDRRADAGADPAAAGDGAGRASRARTCASTTPTTSPTRSSAGTRCSASTRRTSRPSTASRRRSACSR